MAILTVLPMLLLLRILYRKIVNSARFIVEKCARAHSKAFFRRKLSRHNTELGNFWCKSRKFVDDILVDKFFFENFFSLHLDLFVESFRLSPHALSCYFWFSRFCATPFLTTVRRRRNFVIFHKLFMNII